MTAHAPIWQKALLLIALCVPGAFAVAGCVLVMRKLCGRSGVLRRYRESRRLNGLLRHTPKARPEWRA